MAMRTACLVVLLVGGASSASAHDALLEAALSRPALPLSGTTGVVRTTTTVDGGGKPEVETETVDPRKTPKKALPSYADLKNVVGSDAHLLGHDGGRTTYAFTTHHVPRGFTQGGGISVSVDDDDDDERFDGVAEVSKDGGGHPYVSRVELRMHEASGNLVARVKKLDLSYTFGPSAGADAMVGTAMTVDLDVRALFFMHRQVHAESVLVPSS